MNIIQPNITEIGPHLIAYSDPNALPTVLDVGGTKLERMR